MAVSPILGAVVPTVGASPRLIEALEALHGERIGDEPVRVFLVRQGFPESRDPHVAGLCRRVIDLPRNLGFAAATNRGIGAACEDGARWIATVNDDLRVGPGWAAALVAALEAEPDVAAVQGVTLQWDDPTRTDGCGLAWNRWWQAIQLRHGEPPLAPDAPSEEIFGVSATAAVYRRSALEEVALDRAALDGDLDREIFDARLGSYYEDVDLACRLRAVGKRALRVPHARALHAGSATGGRKPLRRWRSIYGNRPLVLARLLGHRFWTELPRILGRDLRDLARAPGTVDGNRALGILAGWGRAALLLSAYAHRGEPRVALAELDRFRVSSPGP